MDKCKIISALELLNDKNPVDYPGHLNGLLEANISTVKNEFDCNLEDAILYLNSECEVIFDDVRAQYICYCFYFLRSLSDFLDTFPEELLSVQQNKKLDNVLRNLVGIGIASLLQPKIPYYTELPSDKQFPEDALVTTRYKRFIFTVNEFYHCMQSPHLKPLIVTTYFKYILAALYQILYHPLKKPSTIPDKSGFLMTNDFYLKVLQDRKYFEKIFNYSFSTKIYISIYVRETMILVRDNSPKWLKLAVSSNLNKILGKLKGVETVICAMLDASGNENPNDSTKSWKVIDIMSRIIMESRKLPDFKENICKQVCKLPDIKSKTEEYLCPFERVFSVCTKYLYEADKDVCRDYFLSRLFKFFNNVATNSRVFEDDENVINEVSQTVRLLNMCFCENQLNAPELPLALLEPYNLIIFHLYVLLFDQKSFSKLCENLKRILIKYLFHQNSLQCRHSIFDSYLFNVNENKLFEVRKGLQICVSNDAILMRNTNGNFLYPPSKLGQALLSLLEGETDLTITFFTYLLSCLTQQQKYFESKTRKDLLRLEDELVLDTMIERKIAVYELLSTLSENKSVQKHLSDDPMDIINYSKMVLEEALETKLHQTSNTDGDEFQSFFVVIMILQQLVTCASEKTLQLYSSLIEPLKRLIEHCSNKELKDIMNNVLSGIKNEQHTEEQFKKDEVTELDKALEDICDPLLPVRGHGLMTLTKLVEKKDENAMKRKQYLLNIFQQNLKHEDSFLYLSAIGGLAAMGDAFPDTVLNTLCEEYLRSQRNMEDGHEIRMKIGEILVRITNILGDMASKYKPLLLNTFLQGTKDDDHLMRASSLSNLGEICRVLGYKLGTIITEVLICVHAIITTDKAIEARRAAVTVLRQLFVGLQKEMIVVLKDEILPIYRTLKNIYHNDPDDVMRLQAQLALEELNENMKEFIFPNPKLHFEKKVIMLS